MKNRQGIFPIVLGLLLIAGAVGLIAWNLFSDKKAQESSADALTQLRQTISSPAPVSAPLPGKEETHSPAPTAEEIVIPDHILNPNMDMPTETVNGWDYIGILEIPAIDLCLPIISQWSDAALNVAPCRYSGSAYTGDLILSGHNYTAHFWYLSDLSTGDNVCFTDIDGNVFSYEVAERETLRPTAVEQMKSGDWDLTLFTCTLGGQSRVTIRCIQTN